MAWNVVFHAERPEKPKIGDMWPAPWLVEDEPHMLFLSDDYIAKWKKGGYRLPLVVRLPDGTDFCVDGPAFENGNRRGSCWTVTGDAPRITVNPSINIVGYYHGWLRDGVISDDCEGRKFPTQG